MGPAVEIICALLLGYALGSIPFGLILAKLFGAGDLRAIGSGNIGATNVLRTGRKGLAAATLLLDLGKGLGAVLIARSWLPGAIEYAAAGAFAGHCFPIWLRFKGGKGVATLMGISLGLAWPIGLAYALTWLGVLAITRISSLAGMTSSVVAPIAALACGQSQFAPVLAVLAVIVLYLHRTNLTRLRDGTEPRIGSDRKP